MNNQKSIRVASLICGLAMILLTLAMINDFPQKADLPEGYRSPIIAFEFARNESEVAYLRGDSASSVANREGMRKGHRWDMVFPIAYAGFLLTLLLQFHNAGAGLKRVAIVACALIVPFDINENIRLLGIVDSAQYGGLNQGLFDDLYIATWLKWGAIAAAVGFLAQAYGQQKRWLLCVTAAMYSLIAAICIALNSPPQLIEIMALMLSLFFLFAFIHQLSSWFKNDESIKGR